MAFSTAGFMGGLAQLIQGKNQNALSNQQAKEKLDERRLQLGMQADQFRKQQIDEERARLTFNETQKDWAQRALLRPFELTAAQTNRDQSLETLAGTRTQNSILSNNLFDLTNQRKGRQSLFDLSVETPRMQTKAKLTSDLGALDATINAQQAIANDVTKSMPERIAAQAAIKSATNMKYATFNNAKGTVGIVPNLTYADIADAAGIRQPDSLKPIDWNTYTGWESHFPQYSPTELRNVLGVSPEGKKSVENLDAQIGRMFDSTKHITQPAKFFDVTKTKGPDGKDFYALNANTPKFEFNKGALASEYFKSPAFTQWLKTEAAANRTTEANVVQQLIGVALTPTTYDLNGKVIKTGDVDKAGNVIMSPQLSERIAANYSTRIATPDKLDETIAKIAGVYSDSQRNAITFWNAQLQSGDVKRTADAAKLTASLSAQSEVFKSSNDSYMKNMNSVDAELAQLGRTLGALSQAGVSGAALIFDEEFKKNSKPEVQRMIQTARELYRKKALATVYETVARNAYGEQLKDGKLGDVGQYARGVGVASAILNSPYRDYTKAEKDMFAALGISIPGPAKTVTQPPNNSGNAGQGAAKPQGGAVGGNQKNNGFNLPPDTRLGAFRTGPIDGRQR